MSPKKGKQTSGKQKNQTESVNRTKANNSVMNTRKGHSQSHSQPTPVNMIHCIVHNKFNATQKNHIAISKQIMKKTHKNIITSRF